MTSQSVDRHERSPDNKATEEAAMTSIAATRPAEPEVTPLSRVAGALVAVRDGRSLLELAPAYALGLLQEHGAVVFRGFNADRGVFERFTRQFAAEFVLPMMRVARPKVEGGADAKTAHVDVGSHAMGLHQELSFTPVRPDAIWLWCEKAAGTGGETTIADGVKLYQALSPAHKALFAAKRLKYSFGGTVSGVAELFNVAPEQLHAALAREAPSLRYTQDGESLSFTYLTPAVQQTKFGHAATFANFLVFSQTAAACGHPEAARVTNLLRFEDDQPVPPDLVAEIGAIADSLTAPIPWQAGDLAFIDNTRMMHGRRSFEAKSERTVYYRAGRTLIGV
jgi:alpha-ketoglutarate-dependent taurine dioxygenase